MAASRRFERYLQVPFAERGSDFDGCHCWGLVRLVYRHEVGIELPAFGDLSAADTLAITREVARERARDTWLAARREDLACFDVAVLAGAGDGGAPVRTAIHCGIMLTPRYLLHIERGTNSVCVRLDHPSVRHRLLSFHRHKDLA